MKFRKAIFTIVGFIAITNLSACSSARYVAHVAKQVPISQDKVAKSKGYFKVGSSYKIKGRRYYPKETYNFTEKGTASWYGPGFHGKMTANGEIFDENELTAAHRTLQLPSIIKVTNLANGRSVVLRVNDRGPFAHDRVLDVSDRAASLLGFKEKGVAKIKLEVMSDESRQVASLAKSGKSTKGYEVSYNQGQKANVAPAPPANPPMSTAVQLPTEEPAVFIGAEQNLIVQGDNSSNQADLNTQTVESAQLPNVQVEPLSGAVQNATAQSMSYVQSVGRVFVQAGSFSQEANALTYSNKLANIGSSRVYMTHVNDKPYYRVRLGPYDNSAQAQKIIASLQQSGNESALIVME